MRNNAGKQEKRACFVVLLAFLLNILCPGQVSRNVILVGRVIDGNGKSVAGAKVTLGNAVTTSSAITARDGRFRIENLAVGVYDLEVSAQGFAVYRKESVSVRTAQSEILTIILQEDHMKASPSKPASKPDPKPAPSRPEPEGPARQAQPPPPPPPRPVSPTGPKAAKAGGPRHRTFADPIWNLWAEPFSSIPSFRPSGRRLHRDGEYSLVVNLAALAYDAFLGEAVYSQDSSSAFSQWLKQHSKLASADVDILVIPDRQYFHPQQAGERTKTLNINLKKLREVQKEGFDLRDTPVRLLQSQGTNAPFSFGIQSFRIRTSSKVGNGSIALSIWADGRPVDELSFSACIVAEEDDECTPPPPTIVSLKGVDLSGNGKYPDAALHLIDRQEEIVGVFRQNSWAKDDYRTWEIEQSADWFSARIEESIKLISHITNSTPQKSVSETFEQAGDAIYNVIFQSRNSQISQVESAFAAFISNARAKVQSGKRTPSLFVRMISSKPELLLAPIGLMRVKLPDNSREFVGFDVNVETPLEFQDYSSTSARVSQWALLVPPEARGEKGSPELQEITDARVLFEDWIKAFRKWCSDCVKEDVDEFRQWLASAAPPASNAVMILSHHSANGLYFDTTPGTSSILTSAIARRFAVPSVVIMAACGTAEPGASEFIRKFNYQGVYSIIATTTEVEATMAGRFLTILMKLLHEHAQDASYTIGRARFEAVKTLSTQPNENPYGPKALVFILVGNGALRLSVPPPNTAAPTSKK